MSFPAEYAYERPSDAPLYLDMGEGDGEELPPSGWAGVAHRLKIPRQWVGMSGYLAAGIFLGLILILALSIGRGSSNDPGVAAASANAITDNVVRLHAHEIGSTCWSGYEKLGPARLTVALEVGIDGRIRYAAASGETSAMRGCVEAHVKSWEFLPQSQAQAMALPFEVDRN